MRRFAIAMIMAAAAIAAAGQPVPLNPTVTVLPQAVSPVPPECEDQLPPLTAERSPAPTVEPPPVTVVETAPSADVRSHLRAAHAAAKARDREGFNAALARAKSMGGASASEREVLTVLDDVARLQEYQYSTPAGSFFDASVQGGSLLKSLSRYPGYDSFIAGQTITDANGNRYYPTRESIEFLLGIAEGRLGRAGVTTAERRVEVPQPPAQPQPRVQPVPAPQPRAAATTPQPRSTTVERRTADRPQKSRPQKSRPQTTRRRPQPQPVAAAEPVEEPPIPSGVVSTPSTSPAVDELPVTTMTGVVDTTATEAPAVDTAIVVDTSTSDQAEERAPVPVQQPSRGRSIIMPLVLILIGVGVLIVLFRASS